MPLTRTVKINTDKNTRDAKVQAALAYLSTWCPEGYNTVEIWDDGRKDMIAHFSDTEKPGRYTIGAVWREDQQLFTMHS